MTRNEIIAICEKLEGASLDRPFAKDRDSVVARHSRTKKWFAVIMKVGGKEFVNLKCLPAEGDFLRGAYPAVKPAYHMNKWHWISVYYQEKLPRVLVEKLISDSYLLTM